MGAALAATTRGGPPSSRIATCLTPPWVTSWSRPSALATTTAGPGRPWTAGHHHAPWPLGAGRHHGELLEAHVDGLALGDVDEEVTTTRASAPARSAAAAAT